MVGRPLSDRALRIVVAAAGAGSFTAAARALDIGQPAVSHAVSRVESAIGVPLFVRSREGITPTEAGEELVARLRSALEEIDDAIRDAQGGIVSTPVTLSVSTSLATYWLAPRLPEFKLAHPDIELRVITTDSDAAVGSDDAELWIPLGPVDRPGLDADGFCIEELVPVSAPHVATRIGSDDPAALLELPLLHLEERYAPRYDWRRWFDHHGVSLPAALPGVRSNDYSLILHAALAGNGLALGWRHIVGPLLDAGQLVEVGPAIRTGSVFPLLRRSGRRLAPTTAALRDWLLAEAPG